MGFIYLEEREILAEAVDLFKEKNIELEDCYNIAYAKAHKMTKFATFDRKLTKHV